MPVGSRGGSAKGERRGGRKKGTPNKKTDELLDMILATGCPHPLEGLATIAVQAMVKDSEDYNPTLAKDCHKELAQYIAPKRKAIEHSGVVDTNEPIVLVLPKLDD